LRLASSPNPRTNKELLVVCAQRLMLKHGYCATTLGMICETTGLSKGVFFHYFDSKKDLAKQTLQRFFQQISSHLQNVYAIAPPDPLERLEALLTEMSQLLSSPGGPHGCLIATLVVECAASEPDLRWQCAQYFRGWAKLLCVPLNEAIDRYAPGAGLNSEHLAYYCISVIEGSLVLARARNNPLVVKQNARLLLQQLRVMLSRA
jgi:AcrR family transcriptional regulator